MFRISVEYLIFAGSVTYIMDDSITSGKDGGVETYYFEITLFELVFIHLN